MPFYNEQENIRRVTGECISALEKLVEDWELILVNDGSKDQTRALADELAQGNARIRAVHHPVNHGYGAALQSGFSAARKEYVFYTDGDGQFDINQIVRLFPLADQYDIVSGYRLDRQDNRIRRFNAWAWGTLVKRLLGFRCRDVDSAFKLYRREIFDHFEMKSNGALIDAEILARANHAGYTLTEVGVNHKPRLAGKSTGGNIKVILKAFRELWRLRKDIRSTPVAKKGQQKAPPAVTASSANNPGNTPGAA
jgi:glycosyltransferase involved in cell wall biosynthesis